MQGTTIQNGIIIHFWIFCTHAFLFLVDTETTADTQTYYQWKNKITTQCNKKHTPNIMYLLWVLNFIKTVHNHFQGTPAIILSVIS